MSPIGYIQEVPWSPVDLEACRQRMSAEESAKDALFWDDELPRPLAAHVGPGEVVIHLILHASFYTCCCRCHQTLPYDRCCFQYRALPVTLHACEHACLMQFMIVVKEAELST